jgi:hypothetical protein
MRTHENVPICKPGRGLRRNQPHQLTDRGELHLHPECRDSMAVEWCCFIMTVEVDLRQHPSEAFLQGLVYVPCSFVDSPQPAIPATVPLPSLPMTKPSLLSRSPPALLHKSAPSLKTPPHPHTSTSATPTTAQLQPFPCGLPQSLQPLSTKLSSIILPHLLSRYSPWRARAPWAVLLL